jgi:phosphoglycerol transferase
LPCAASTAASFSSDQKFVQDIEKMLPSSAAIFQMPYVPFPEAAPVHQLHSYVPLVGFLHSKTLRWSSGSMQGRDGDLFYRAVSTRTVPKQIEIAKKLGFSGVYIDLLGFKDGGVKLMTELDQIPGVKRALVNDSKTKAFYLIDKPSPVIPAGMPSIAIMKRAGFFADIYGERYEAQLSEGVDFSKASLPTFIKNIKGLSGVEPGGRWSDAKLNRSVIIGFVDPLPDSFTLGIAGEPYGPNIGKPVTIRVGKTASTVTFSGYDEKRIKIANPDHSNMVEIVPPVPTDEYANGRRLGLSIKRLWIE